MVPDDEDRSRFVSPQLCPLFWQHGESADVLREEMRRMHDAGIGAFIVESRPHPDFLGRRWWHDLQVILDEAERLGMQVWLFDDEQFPSGYAAGQVRDRHPEYLKVYLDERHVDVLGPRSGGSVLIAPWLGHEESLLGVVAGRRADGDRALEADSLVVLTDRVVDGVLYWDVPPGDWRVFALVRTREGGEARTSDYVNPLDREAVRAYIEAVHAPHFERFGDAFGKTIAGFFSDEPRFGNAATYEAAIGRFDMVLPWSDDLPGELAHAWGEDFLRMLPCLWYDAGEKGWQARYTYMECITGRYSEHFSKQIGQWCRAHGVRLIGHVVEDNGAHSRLGYGSGHFFRALAGQDTSGFDIVHQVWPGRTSGRLTSPFGYLDCEFFYWGLAKLASSAAHLDPLKGGTTACEIFGAYGWQAGLRLMKWLTDHVCVRGTNVLIPHAFSPKFPDPDCPPHFYARGHNPQWRHFRHWSAYAARLCRTFSGGRHVASVAVLYHAEAEWSGTFQPFQSAVKTLADAHLDCDIVSADMLCEVTLAAVEDQRLRVHEETFGALIVPSAERLPSQLLRRLVEFAEAGLPVFFIDALPVGTSDPAQDANALLHELAACGTCAVPAARLAESLDALGLRDLTVEPLTPHLRHYHYVRGEQRLYFLVNESPVETVDAEVTFQDARRAVGWDALYDRWYRLSADLSGARCKARLRLAPFESLVVVFSDTAPSAELPILPSLQPVGQVVPVEGPWQVSTATAEQWPRFTHRAAINRPCNLALPERLPRFSGTIRYDTTFQAEAGRRTVLDLGDVHETAEVTLNDVGLGVRICPPYRFDLKPALQRGTNRLRVEVTNTLAKAAPHSWLDRFGLQDPSGLVGPVTLRMV